MTNILSTNKLTQMQIKQIRTMEKQCNSVDGTNGELWLSNEFNLHTDMPCYFLLYEKEMLQGVLTIFAPTKNNAEVSALVLQGNRRKGHFNAMLSEAKEQFEKFEVQDVFLVHETKSMDGKDMIAKWNIAPHHSEYLLVYDKENVAATDKKTDVQLAQAREEDFEQMLKINAAIFGGSEEDFGDMLRKSISGDKILCYKAILNGNVIGVCNVNRTNQGLYIFGFGISPDHQRRGCGRALLDEVNRLLVDSYSDDILLEVDSDNNVAFMLYTTSGFMIRTQYDYYKRTMADI